MLNISLHQLEYVVAVGKSGSIKAAAEKLHISQPSLSVAITKVEEHLGQKLFLRTRGKMVSPTGFGRTFIRQAETLLADAQRLMTFGKEETNPQSRDLILGCFTDLAPIFIGQALQSLQSSFPAAAVSFETGDFLEISQALQGGEIDMAITYNIGLDARFEKRTIREISPHAFLAPQHPLVSRSNLTLREISKWPVILSQEGLSVQHFLNLFKAEDLDPVAGQSTRSIEAMRTLAANNAGIGLSYTNPPNRLAYDGRELVSIPVSTPSCIEPIMLVTLKDQADDEWLTSAATLLAESLKESI